MVNSLNGYYLFLWPVYFPTTGIWKFKTKKKVESPGTMTIYIMYPEKC